MNNFNFEAERQRLIENLNYLKSLSVEEYTFRRKWDEIRHHIEAERDYIHQADHFMWRPRKHNCATDADPADAVIAAICEIKPRVIIVGDKRNDEANFRYWEAYRYFLSSGEHNGVPGRYIRILIVDDFIGRGRVLGIASIASDVNSIGHRDKFIGWTAKQRMDGLLRNTAIGSTIVPTQPFGFNMLGGKLCAALATSRIVRDEWQLRYGDLLAGMTTTGLYKPPCIYDSLPWWKKLGYTKGDIPIQPAVEIYLKWRAWVRAHRKKEFADITATKDDRDGAAVSEKTRVLNLIFETVGISPKDYVHGFPRSVYFSSFYENTKDFLCGRASENELRLKRRFQNDVEAIMDWWRPRAIKRYQMLKQKGKLKGRSPLYNHMDEMDYQTAKDTFLDDVGR